GLVLSRLQLVELLRLSSFWRAGYGVNQRDVVQDGAEIRIRNVGQTRTGLESGLIISEGRFGFAEIIANKSKSPRGTKQRPIVRRLRFFEKGVRFDQVRFGGGAIAGLVVKLPDLFEAEGVIRIARLEGALRK